MHKSFLATEGQNAIATTPQPIPKPTEEREFIKVMLLGSPKAVNQTIQVLYLRGFAQVWEWSPLQPTQKAGEVISVLKRQI